MAERAPKDRSAPSRRGRPRLEEGARSSRAEATRSLLLDTAERLFALQGYDATGVRQIAEEAGVNLGAIHYYWRTKDMLCRDALERRLVPILQERSGGLDRVEAAGGALPDLLDASHGPSLRSGGSDAKEAAAFRRFYGRMLFDPSPEVQAILASLLDTYAVRFIGLLREQCGHLDDNEFYWRVTFMYGAFLYAHTQHTRATALWGGRFDQQVLGAASRFLTRFLDGALRAPAADAPWPLEKPLAERRSTRSASAKKVSTRPAKTPARSRKSTR
jgi:AcrR family transcriptional regulator